jgi:hypothetical protein
MIRYYFRGIEVPREGALKAWRASKTYRGAALADSVFAKAEAGIDTDGVTNHLAEAHIRIDVAASHTAPADGGSNG